MHGTWVGEGQISAFMAQPLKNGDVVKFGAEVTRGAGMLPDEGDVSPKLFGNSVSWLPMFSSQEAGSCLSNGALPETFPALEMKVTYEWMEEQDSR